MFDPRLANAAGSTCTRYMLPRCLDFIDNFSSTRHWHFSKTYVLALDAGSTYKSLQTSSGFHRHSFWLFTNLATRSSQSSHFVKFWARRSSVLPFTWSTSGRVYLTSRHHSAHPATSPRHVLGLVGHRHLPSCVIEQQRQFSTVNIIFTLSWNLMRGFGLPNERIGLSEAAWIFFMLDLRIWHRFATKLRSKSV